MANDDASVLRAARNAAKNSREHLGKAQRNVASARKEFKAAVGAFSWGSVGDKLARRRGEELKKLQKALDDADAALAHALRACQTLDAAL